MFLFAVIACLNILCSGQPARDPRPVAEAGNLKYTFGDNEEIPAAFFNNPRQRSMQERKSYPSCQDGSGGLCVEFGQCPPEMKVQNSTGACASPLECCYGPPANDKSCGSRGGECTSPSQCGRAPQFKEATDCDSKKGEVCCIFI